MMNWMFNVLEFLFLLLVATVIIVSIVGLVLLIVVITKEAISDFLSGKRK